MANLSYSLLDLDVDKLFETHSIDEIIEIEKLLDAEVEKKRVELRGMVGDRYKDVLTASDAIKSMKSISEEIVSNIQSITEGCENLISDASITYKSNSLVVDPKTTNERVIIMQIRLAMIVNSHIWMAIEEEEFSKAAQIYLLAQHISTGLQLLSKEVMDSLSILKRMKSDLDALRNRILKRTKEKLQIVQLTVEETASNLTALVLLEQFSNSSDLVNIFIDLRKSALSKVINEPHSSVRIQVTAMLKCLVTTVHLLHECFINYKSTNSGLVWQQLENIESDNSPTTLSKITLPTTPLIIYIPDLIKQFRPKRVSANCTSTVENMSSLTENWLKYTSEDVRGGLQNTLELVTNIKALHVVREEALKIDLPSNWDTICNNSYLPKNFHIWFYFFQELITNRVKNLMSTTISTNLGNLQNNINRTLDEATKRETLERDLRWYTWKEEDGDISRYEKNHSGLSMKTKGYSPSIVKLCLDLDQKFLELINDLSLYLYGKDSKQMTGISIKENSRIYVDKKELENVLKDECSLVSKKLISYLENFSKLETEKDGYIAKSLLCARFLQALNELCPNFKRCCSCDGKFDKWEQVCVLFHKESLKFWKNWMDSSISEIEAIGKELRTTLADVLYLLPKWDTREIQEQTDEKIFKSRIKVPSQPSLHLEKVIIKLSDQMSAIIPHTLPRQIHVQYIEKSTLKILEQYDALADCELNQVQALQFLFDVKFITTLCIPRENLQLISKSQGICDKLRLKVDPFDLDVFYSYLQNNVKICVLQKQVILGCLLPSSGHLINLGTLEKNRDSEREPSILAVSVPTTTAWFPLLPVTTPVQKMNPLIPASVNDIKVNALQSESTKKHATPPVSSVRSGAAAFFGAMTNDWFS